MSMRSPHVILPHLGVLCLLAGCTSVPPETLIVQKKTIQGINAARRSQITLVEQIATEKKERLRISYESALPGVLKELFPNVETYTEAQMREAITEYNRDLAADYRKIDEGKTRLIGEVNAFFDDLVSIAELNEDFLESSLAAQRTYKAAFDSMKVGDKTFSEYLVGKFDLQDQ